MSAVSKQVIPASSAASTTAAVAGPSRRVPKLLQPRPTAETSSEPMRRVFTLVYRSRRRSAVRSAGVPGASSDASAASRSTRPSSCCARERTLLR